MPANPSTCRRPQHYTLVFSVVLIACLFQAAPPATNRRSRDYDSGHAPGTRTGRQTGNSFPHPYLLRCRCRFWNVIQIAMIASDSGNKLRWHATFEVDVMLIC